MQNLCRAGEALGLPVIAQVSNASGACAIETGRAMNSSISNLDVCNDGTVDAGSPIIVTIPAPIIYATAEGKVDETNAALYLSHQMRSSVRPRTMRSWRAEGVGPAYHAGPRGRPVWYRIADLDEYVEISSSRSPDETLAA